MRLFVMSATFAATLVACSPPAQRDAPEPSPRPGVVACNEVTPDRTRPVNVTDPTAAAAAAADLRGGRIVPGTYDLASAVRVGQATGWAGPRAVALAVTENPSGGVVFNWAGAAPGAETDRWTANFTETPTPRLEYTCGRMGEVEADFTATSDALELRLPDGANGSLLLSFQRRA